MKCGSITYYRSKNERAVKQCISSDEQKISSKENKNDSFGQNSHDHNFCNFFCKEKDHMA